MKVNDDRHEQTTAGYRPAKSHIPSRAVAAAMPARLVSGYYDMRVGRDDNGNPQHMHQRHIGN